MPEVFTGREPKVDGGETKLSNIFEMYEELQGLEENYRLVLAQLDMLVKAEGEGGGGAGNSKHRLESKVRALASYINDAEQRLFDREKMLANRDPLNKFGEISKNPRGEAHAELDHNKTRGVAMIKEAIDIGMRQGPQELVKAIQTGGLLDR